MLTAIETTGTININHQLILDEALPISEKSRVRVIVLFDENSNDINEKDWLKSASRNQAFDFLNNETEDLHFSRRKTFAK
jgi:hypothetical protein